MPRIHRLATSAAVLWLAPAAATADALGSPAQAPPQAAAALAVPPSALMPQPQDHTLMWWSDGFPGHPPAAPWRRVVRTGSYAFALDTDTLRVPHLGPLAGAGDYLATACGDDRSWRVLPPADLVLTITTGPTMHRCTAGGAWTQFTGPRLIESGRFVQRADVTDLVFTAPDDARLNVEARFETVAWPDRLALVLAARPGLAAIPAGEACFGRVGGGFGLDGTNHWETPHDPALDAERFTLELWAYVPADWAQATRAFPWLACIGRHEEADGNIGLVILDGKPQARLNIGGGRANRCVVDGREPLAVEKWNHLALSYDGGTLRLYQNGAPAGERRVGRRFNPGRSPLTIGRRQDGDGDGYHFRGAVDEVRFHDRALSADEIRARFHDPAAGDTLTEPRRAWAFRPDGTAAATRPRERWEAAAIEINLTTAGQPRRQRWAPADGQPWTGGDWREVAVVLDPGTGLTESADTVPRVAAAVIPSGRPCEVDRDAVRGWQRVCLDGIEPLVPPGGGPARANDAIERVRLALSNPTDREQVARLLFEKAGGGIRQRIGAPITGVSAVLRDRDGKPTGIPVQLSKNWHGRPAGGIHAGTWFHGFSQVRLPPRAEVELELTLAYGHWGGLPAASHAQLCLIGWGSNQLWEQSALGAWGESICYEPDQVQAECSILDVRPLMVRSMTGGQRWQWTHNVGGGDYFRLFDPAGRRIPHAAMRTAFLRHGPCLTEVTHAGRLGETIRHRATASLGRTTDLVRGVYQLRCDVDAATDFSRFVIFQLGADTYSYTGERMMALGHEHGLTREWPTRWDGDTYRTPPLPADGRTPWVSLHQAAPRTGRQASGDDLSDTAGAWANRGLVIRSWQARLGGKPAGPWVAERGVRARGTDTSTLDLVPPPGVSRLEPGDFVEATIELLVVPQAADDYYGPDEALRAALREHADTWRMVHREATGNERTVAVTTGKLLALHPAVAVEAAGDTAAFTLTGGLGHVPVMITGLTQPQAGSLLIDGRPLDQSIHGNDFWQTDFDPAARRWTRTYNLPAAGGRPRVVRFNR